MCEQTNQRRTFYLYWLINQMLMNEIRILIDQNFIQRHTNAKFTINFNNLLEKSRNQCHYETFFLDVF